VKTTYGSTPILRATDLLGTLVCNTVHYFIPAMEGVCESVLNPFCADVSVLWFWTKMRMCKQMVVPPLLKMLELDSSLMPLLINA